MSHTGTQLGGRRTKEFPSRELSTAGPPQFGYHWIFPSDRRWPDLNTFVLVESLDSLEFFCLAGATRTQVGYAGLETKYPQPANISPAFAL